MPNDFSNSGDVLGSLWRGMQQGRANNAARAKASQDYQLQLMDKSAALLKQAEAEFKLMDDATKAEGWDPSMTRSLLDRAARFDSAYGSVWGGSAYDYFVDALNLTRSDPQKEGKQGPPGPADPIGGPVPAKWAGAGATPQAPAGPSTGLGAPDGMPAQAKQPAGPSTQLGYPVPDDAGQPTPPTWTKSGQPGTPSTGGGTPGGPRGAAKAGPQASPMAGYRTPQQAQQAITNDRVFRTQQAAPQIQQGFFDMLDQSGGVEGLDPQTMTQLALRYQAKVTAEGDYDYKIVQETMDDIIKGIEDMGAEYLKSSGQSAEAQRLLLSEQKALNDWISSELGAEKDLKGNIVSNLQGTEALRGQMSFWGSRMLKIGMDVPSIQIALAQMFRDDEGLWGGKDANGNKTYSQTTPYFRMWAHEDPAVATAMIAKVQELYDSGLANPITDTPQIDPETGWMGLVRRADPKDPNSLEWVAADQFIEINKLRNQKPGPSGAVAEAEKDGRKAPTTTKTSYTVVESPMLDMEGEYGTVEIPASHEQIWDDYGQLMVEYGEKYNVDPRLILMLVGRESRGVHNAVSEKGAAGLTQLMPVAVDSLANWTRDGARWVNTPGRGIIITDRFDPAQSIEGGAAYLSLLMHGKEGAREGGNLEYYLGSYNAGADAVNNKNALFDYPETVKYIQIIGDAYRNIAGSSEGIFSNYEKALNAAPPPDAGRFGGPLKAIMGDDIEPRPIGAGGQKPGGGSPAGMPDALREDFLKREKALGDTKGKSREEVNKARYADQERIKALSDDELVAEYEAIQGVKAERRWFPDAPPFISRNEEGNIRIEASGGAAALARKFQFIDNSDYIKRNSDYVEQEMKRRGLK